MATSKKKPDAEPQSNDPSVEKLKLQIELQRVKEEARAKRERDRELAKMERDKHKAALARELLEAKEAARTKREQERARVKAENIERQRAVLAEHSAKKATLQQQERMAQLEKAERLSAAAEVIRRTKLEVVEKQRAMYAEMAEKKKPTYDPMDDVKAFVAANPPSQKDGYMHTPDWSKSYLGYKPEFGVDDGRRVCACCNKNDLVSPTGPHYFDPTSALHWCADCGNHIWAQREAGTTPITCHNHDLTVLIQKTTARVKELAETYGNS